MSTSVVLHATTCDALYALDPRQWVDELRSRLVQGERLITLYGRPQADSVVVTAVLQAANRRLAALRTTMDPARGYHSLTTEFAALHCFERELHEQCGVRVAGHPWLKPIRFERGGPEEMARYPFFKIEGKEVHEVAVGPIHAGVIEPGAFRFMCEGETVHHLEIHLGYQHRGVEKLLLQRDPRALAPLVETVAGDTSIGHGWAYCAALEALGRFNVPLHVEAARGVMLELERIAMHLAGLAGLAGDIGFLQGASTYGRLRTTAINATMRLCGSRFGRSAMRAGGSGARLDDDGATELRKAISLLQTDLKIINECFLGSRTVQHRLRDVGKLSAEQAHELGLVGLSARACGAPLDQRTGSGIYELNPIECVTEGSGDCWARACVRIREMDQSLAWIARILDSFPTLAPSREEIGALAPSQLAITVCEGWRGEVVHCLETDETGRLLHYKVQDPSLRNWLGLAIALRGNEISDFPICNKSFDLSYCGNDL
jgi:Ni,Fe-hydrogenase III large subunit